MSISWKKYFDTRSQKGERELLREALQYVTIRAWHSIWALGQ
jgi:hypothetical protein